MLRFVGGAVSALLLAAAGLFLWTGSSGQQRLIPAPPAAMPQSAEADAPMAPDVPAATARSREERRFARYDRDRDGVVSRDEYLAARRKAFAKIDLDRDGRLSFEEYAARTTAKFGSADQDGSGTLAPTEFARTRVVRRAPLRCAPATPTTTDDG